jgi:hypothetical protein
MKVVIGLPTANDPSPAFIKSLSELQLPAGVSSLDRVIVTGNFVPGQRELIVRKAAAMKADILVMMDDDMVLPPHTLTCLLETLAADPRLAIVGVLYYSRDGSQPMAVAQWSSDNVSAATIPPFTDASPVYVDGVGFGCVAIRMRALQELDLPLFNTQVIIEEEASLVRICNEDYLLCERLRAAGWHIGLDSRVRAGHYDRNSAVTHPIKWETNDITAQERALVLDAEGQVRLVPMNKQIPCIKEEHQIGKLDYLIR